MTNNPEGILKAMETQLDKYGGKEGLSKEMARRAALRKSHGTGGFKTWKETGQTDKIVAAARAGGKAKRKKREKEDKRPLKD